MDNERRREDDRFVRIIEQNGEIKALISSTNSRIESLSKDLKEHAVAIAEIRYSLWGGPKESDIGLIEKHRKLNRNWVIAMSICAFIFSALGKIISPLYDKVVTDWAFNSPSEKWSREQKRPRVRRYIINEQPTPTPEP